MLGAADDIQGLTGDQIARAAGTAWGLTLGAVDNGRRLYMGWASNIAGLHSYTGIVCAAIGQWQHTSPTWGTTMGLGTSLMLHDTTMPSDHTIARNNCNNRIRTSSTT